MSKQLKQQLSFHLRQYLSSWAPAYIVEATNIYAVMTAALRCSVPGAAESRVRGAGAELTCRVAAAALAAAVGAAEYNSDAVSGN